MRLWHESIAPFFNSTFLTSLVGAGAGAWAGAYAAQKIAMRSKARDELLNEIRSSNSGVRLAGMICNACLTLKKQHVKALKETYEKTKAELNQPRNNPVTPQKIFKFTADFQTIPSISIPNETFEALQKIVFEKLNASTRATILVPTLLQAINHFNSAIADRNALIEEIRTSRPHDDQQLAEFYFGLRDAQGNTDNRYGSVIDALSSYIDDSLFFSKTIADDLGSHGRLVKEQLKRRFPNEMIEATTFGIAESYREFLPSPSNYPGWEKLS